MNPINNIPNEKICAICGEIKPITMFYKNKKTKDGHLTRCKLCDEKIHKQWRYDHSESEHKKRVARYIQNRDQDIQNAIKWNKEHPDKVRISKAKWANVHREQQAVAQKLWRYRNKDRVRKNNALWKAKNIDKVRECARNSNYKRRNKPGVRLNDSISTRIYESLRGKKSGRTWQILVGYTSDQLKRHIEKQFMRGMSWENYGDWHVDHVIPRSVFNFEKPEDIDFKRCWALSNLRPLWARDNLIKYNKIEKPFQPSLAIAV